MNGGSGGGRGSRKVSGMPLVDRKDRDDEDLMLFRELDKRERDRIASLLQPVSEEFEPNAAAGNYALYRIASRKKGSGYEFFAENERNDYDWLKTPPATPLFPSLEMEAKASELAVQREIPVLQPLSRFSGNSAPATKESTTAPKSPKAKPKPKALPMKSIVPSHQKQNIETKNTKAAAAAAAAAATTTTTTILNNKIDNTKRTEKESQLIDFITSNICKDIRVSDTKTKARSRGVSPSVRSIIPSDRSTSAARNRPSGNSSLSTQMNQFSSDPTRPNLRTTTNTTNRSTSAARNRPTTRNLTLGAQSYGVSDDHTHPNLKTSTTNRSTSAARNRAAAGNSGLSAQINQLSNDPPANLRTTTDRSTSATRGRPQNPSTYAIHRTLRRQSRSPSVTRGGKEEVKQQESREGNGRGRFQTGIVGSKMVEKVMNARKYSEEKEAKSNTTGFGWNLMSKSSLDTALRQTEMKRDGTNSRYQGTVRGRSLTRSSE